ncbi:aminopeptidase 1 [Thermosipho melanesiensis]|uniref:M18 family aminopeptidase n=2 Tax=Thermosipho melanesiensis TaxID=46541 RepID=A6LN74_THEM4|nr:aminopeptidase [Thermosipho melanesiensis]ABR31375.1 peptidase M18, aminopeptidase I [Thermosipho melanesiensis BI429]APT74435.1 aminopeptidase 1 [Thermosipho melanesiensis]OOC36397.1 aminopeptidase 1 [Thermosipho melanesiensis]OOC37215.1 aminopeptidase 1 [Thermosipho melanesiensis]OOC37967.1 aminopeptidase 1 [Thermosipho melanesiensis]
MDNLWTIRNTNDVEKFVKNYRNFIDTAVTERLAISFFEEMLKKSGFISLNEYTGVEEKVYYINASKSLIAVRIVSDPKEGFNIIASHVDSPRFDLKPNPLFEDEAIAMLKTHYYGGVKLYQWYNIPLALVGVVFKADGTRIDINIGFDEDDPIFLFADLLPHLDRKDEKLSEKFQGEKMNLVVGSIPLEGEEKDAVKRNVLRILKEKYNIEEEDFISADIEIVPAFKSREVGFDRSMIAAYGQDDRICAFQSVKALIDAENLEKSAAVILFDREEIGSEGNAGAKARFYKKFFRKVLKIKGEKDVEFALDELIENSFVVSADVAALVNPNFKDVHDKLNAPKIGKGVVVVKYTGMRGKAGASEAHAETLLHVRKVLNNANIKWQVGTLGKIGVGGGGTVAKFLAQEGFNVIDMGPGLLSMHSPYEIVSKVDLFETYLAYKELISKR